MMIFKDISILAVQNPEITNYQICWLIIKIKLVTLCTKTIKL